MQGKIIDLLRQYGRCLPIDFIARALETTVQAASSALNDLERRGVIQRTGQGLLTPSIHHREDQTRLGR
jgi:DNA-binding Lrp family transcriptional regulator